MTLSRYLDRVDPSDPLPSGHLELSTVLSMGHLKIAQIVHSATPTAVLPAPKTTVTSILLRVIVERAVVATIGP
ncbi:hypothetical protein [Mycobacterium uberis]|uniref:hypothetical protein n=1 Tax=Mycobacterium uberis TaxID=2162698 RepID=UPI001FB56262|nr:hypothetical protein [Mycobacterium uberis]